MIAWESSSTRRVFSFFLGIGHGAGLILADSELYGNIGRWQAVRDSLRALEHDEGTWISHELIEPEWRELASVLEPLRIDVPESRERAARQRIYLLEHEGRARPLLLDSVRPCERLCERGLPCPELAGQRHERDRKSGVE